MERPAIEAILKILVRGPGLCQRALFRECNDKMQRRIVALEAGNKHLREGERSDFATVDEVGQFEHRGEGKVFDVRRGLGLTGY